MYHQKTPLRKTETIYCLITNNNAREYKFTDNETTLGDVVIEAIAVHTDAVGSTKEGVTLLPLADLKKSYLSIVSKTGVILNKEFPIESFLSNDNFFTDVKPFNIDIPKSKVLIPHSPTLVLPIGPPAGYAILVTFMYREKTEFDKFDKDGYLITGN